MPAQLILMNPSRPGAARRARAAGGTKVGKAVKAALRARRPNPSKKRQAAKKASKAAGSPRTNPKESKMAKRRKKSASRSVKSYRSNPRKPPPVMTPAQREAAKAKSKATRASKANIRADLFNRALAAGLFSEAELKNVRKAVGVKAPKAAPRAKLTEAEKAARKAARKSASAGRRSASKGAVRQAFLAFRRGEISAREYGMLIGAGKKGQKKQASRLAKAMRRPATRSSAEFFGPTHVRAFAWKNQTAEGSAGRKMASLYLTVKRKIKLETDPTARLIAKQLGLTSLPNAGGVKGVISDLKAALPMAAFAAGGIALVGFGVSKIIPQIASRIDPKYAKYLVPGIALTVGLGGAMVMKKYKGLAKYSGAVAVGGVAIATMAVMNSSAWAGADGKTLAQKIAPGVLSLGDYHMGMTVGDYHVGGALNVGDYHMGAIEHVNARRMLAPAGQPMPRHDTRRDGVDSSIDQFNGTLAGDIFDQN